MYNLETYLAYLLVKLYSPHTYFHQMSPLDLLDRLGHPLDQMPRYRLNLHRWRLLRPLLLLDPLGQLDPLDLPDLLGLSFLFPLAVLE